MRKLYPLTALPLLLILFIGAGCTIEQEALVKTDGSGNVNFNFTVEPYFFDTLKEMSQLAGETNSMSNGQLFDVEQIKKDFSQKKEIQLGEISTPKKEVLQGTFSFQNISRVFEDEDKLMESGIISFERNPGQTRINVYLDKKNYKQVSQLFPIVDNPLFEMFGPQEGEKISEEEYLELITLAFGEEGAEGLKKSVIQLKVNVQGTIVSQSGGRIVGNSVIFDIPLIRVLTLNEPLRYHIIFK